MAQQEAGDPGKTLPDQPPPGLQVVCHPVPAAFWAEIQPGPAGGHGGPMAQMVVARHGEAMGRQVFRKGFIAQDVLRHAVGNLQNGLDGSLRKPLHRVNGGLPVCGGKGKFVSDHGKSCLPVIYYWKIGGYELADSGAAPPAWRPRPGARDRAAGQGGGFPYSACTRFTACSG